jgi:hypothetical protein
LVDCLFEFWVRGVAVRAVLDAESANVQLHEENRQSNAAS